MHMHILSLSKIKIEAVLQNKAISKWQGGLIYIANKKSVYNLLEANLKKIHSSNILGIIEKARKLKKKKHLYFCFID